MPGINYSIIIPHRDIPKLLKRCLDSIPQRGDVQIIVVDDNSDPTIVDFAQFPGSKRSDVEIYYTKEGKGAGYARNVGLDYVRGKWILYADADDFFVPNFLSILDKFTDNSADIIYFTSDSVDSETLVPVLSRMEYLKSAIRNNKYDIVKYSNAVPWGKMIRASLVIDNKLRYDELPVSNDVMFSLYVADKARKIKAVDIPIYISTVRQGSLFYSVDEERLKTRMDVVKKASAFLMERGLWRIKPNRFVQAHRFLEISKKSYFIQVKAIVKEEPFYIVVYDFLRYLKFIAS
jgi:glycosyltransferase involved in cell wall biosynthesis